MGRIYLFQKGEKAVCLALQQGVRTLWAKPQREKWLCILWITVWCFVGQRRREDMARKKGRNIHEVVKHIQRLCNYHMHGAGENLQEIMRQSGLCSIRCLEKSPTFVVRGLKFNSWLNQLTPCRNHLMSLSPTFLIFRNRFNINACSLYLMKFHKHWLT